jgi:hypothetical protein
MAYVQTRLAATLTAGLLLQGCATTPSGPPADVPLPPGPRSLKKLTIEERRRLLERAKVWQQIDTASLDLLAGSPQPPALRVEADAACTFVFPDKPLSGNTPKFDCALSPGDVVKVKYGPENGEVYAEVAATRLFWALGFQTDAMYPARVTCAACPPDPFAASKRDWKRGRPSNVATGVFDPAAIEREIPGEAIEVPGFEGWAWPELDIVSEAAGGASRAQIDALKLLAVFVQHSDSKPEQQKLFCQGEVAKDADGNETCTSPWLFVKDLGTSFGKATRRNISKMRLTDWSEPPVWKNGEPCVGNLPRSFTGTLDNPRISEAGRGFLADRLMLLSDRQIGDLFRASRVELREEVMTGEDGRRRPVRVDDWVRVFKAKRDEVVRARCSA